METITLLDTVTGETKEIESKWPAFYWTEGNGSCDCNRELAFGRETDSDTCLGEERYLIIKSTYDGYSLDELNEDYPDEPKQIHLK